MSHADSYDSAELNTSPDLSLANREPDRSQVTFVAEYKRAVKPLPKASPWLLPQSTEVECLHIGVFLRIAEE